MSSGPIGAVVAAAVLAAAIAAAAIWFWSMRMHRARRVRWRRFARERGFAFERDAAGFRISGIHEGRAVVLRTLVRGSDGAGWPRELELATRLVPGPPDDVRVRSRAAWLRPLEAVADAATALASDDLEPRRSLETSDDAFDAAFAVEARDAARASSWLDARRRSALLALLEHLEDTEVELRDGELVLRLENGEPAVVAAGDGLRLVSIAADELERGSRA